MGLKLYVMQARLFVGADGLLPKPFFGFPPGSSSMVYHYVHSLYIAGWDAVKKQQVPPLMKKRKKKKKRANQGYHKSCTTSPATTRAIIHECLVEPIIPVAPDNESDPGMGVKEGLTKFAPHSELIVLAASM